METSEIEIEGIRRRSGMVDNKAPVPTTTVKMDTKADVTLELGKPYHPLLQWARIVVLVGYFIIACLCMHVTQWIGAPSYFYDKEWYYSWMALTKQHFGLLIVTMQQWWSPTIVRVSGDASVRGQLKETSDGKLESDFPERMVLISNHEIYTDWLYLWWSAYTARMHGHIFIILKESLKYIPLLGPGMLFFSFVFLTRNWAQDKPRFAHRLNKLKRKQDGAKAYNPMWMLIFPEGTNASRNGRAKSAAWAKKNNIPDLKHALLPRSTGLHFCLEELGDTIDWVYDCTLAYEGIPRGEFGQDVFSIKGIYLQGRAPKSVSLYWRRFAVKDIPMDPIEFDKWLQQVWREKDDMLEYYADNGRFPADEDAPVEHVPVPNGAGVTMPVKQQAYIDTKIMPESPFEFLQIFIPALTVALVLYQIRRMWGWLLVAIRGK